MNINYPKTYTLSIQPYYDAYLQCYKNVISINIFPDGPLGALVHKTKLYPLSHFKTPGPCNPLQKCGLILHSVGNECNGCCKGNLMTAFEIPNLFSFLLANGYKIDTSLTKMMSENGIVPTSESKILCFISYSPYL